MATLEIAFAEELAETAHWSDEPPVSIENQEFDRLAFELWHLGSLPLSIEIEEWPDEPGTVASRSSCL
jgi:hypothetical protein